MKLYIKRVFITESEKELLPVYMRFIRGIIDSEDLPLNVSREILQKNRVMESIRSSSVRKILQELALVSRDRKVYETFWNEFGRVLKEGILQDYEHRDQLLELVRYKSTTVEGWTSLSEYRDRMQKDQKAIYYITGDRKRGCATLPSWRRTRRAAWRSWSWTTRSTRSSPPPSASSWKRTSRRSTAPRRRMT